jgi:glycosyltransferase involved in cell wall biosynthesis
MKHSGSSVVFAQGIAVVVSTYNRPHALNLVLQSLAEQSVPADQIIVGDDGSGRETADLIKGWNQRGLTVEHVWHEDQGYRKAIAMNEAICRVRYSTTLFIDGDCIAHPNLVAHHKAYSEPGAILAGARILVSKNFTEELERGFAQYNLAKIFDVLWLRLSGRINRLLPLLTLPDGSWRKCSPKKWPLVRGCNFSVETTRLWAADGFEESLEGWGYDDSELAVRLINAGAEVKTLRFAAPVLHLWHKEELRDRLSVNGQHLTAAILENRIRAIRGLSRHKAP